MIDASQLLTSVVILAVIAFLLWFALGTQRNIRRGNDILTWLQTGLPKIGQRTALRWLGSSVIELKIRNARDPFAEAEVLVVLEARDLGWLWAWGRSRGRRDFIVMRGRLNRPPAFEVEAGNVGGWTGQDRLRTLDEPAWRPADWGDPEIKVLCSRDIDATRPRRLWEELHTSSAGVWRMSIRKDVPHIEVHVLPPDISQTSSEPIFEAFREIGRDVASRA